MRKRMLSNKALSIAGAACMVAAAGLLSMNCPQPIQAQERQGDLQALTVRSYDQATGEGVEGTMFQLYGLEGVAVEDGRVAELPSTLTGYDERWRLLDTAGTDKGGVLSFGVLDYGMYMVVESAAAPGYQTSTETAKDGEAADMRLTAHIFAVDIDRPVQLQMFEHAAISLGVQVETGVSDTDFTVNFDAAGSNTYLDEYWSEISLAKGDTGSAWRAASAVLPRVQGDSDGFVDVLVKGEGLQELPLATEMSFAQPALHQGSRGGGDDRFQKEGWRYVGRYKADDPSIVDVCQVLGDDAELSALALCYGSVEKEFASTTSLSVRAVGFEEVGVGEDVSTGGVVQEGELSLLEAEDGSSMTAGDIIVCTAGSHGTRNYAAAPVGSDDASAVVQEREGIVSDSVSKVELALPNDGFDPDSSPASEDAAGESSALAKTSDYLFLVAFFAVLAAGIAGSWLLVSRQRLRD